MFISMSFLQPKGCCRALEHGDRIVNDPFLICPVKTCPHFFMFDLKQYRRETDGYKTRMQKGYKQFEIIHQTQYTTLID